MDSGASGDFISIEFAQKNAINIRPTPPVFTTTAVNTQNNSFVIGDVELSISFKGFEEKRLFKVIDLHKYDIILGITFLQKHNPKINWVEFDIDFQDTHNFNNNNNNNIINQHEQTTPTSTQDVDNCDDESEVISDKDPINSNKVSEINLLDYRDMKKSLNNKHDQHYLIMINSIDSNQNIKSELPKDIMGLVQKFNSVFPDELPSRLPPSRNI